MASFRAFQATDMRVEIAQGFLDSFSLDRIVVTDGRELNTFHGLFSFGRLNPLFGGVILPEPGDLAVLLLAQTAGRLTGYDVTLGSGFLRYTVDQLDVDARAAFQTLVFDGTAAFQRIVFAGADSFIGSRFADVLIGYGGNDQFSGFDGADRLLGGNGLDRVFGGNGDDVMTGGEGRDWLFGGDHDDVLVGNSGGDFLRGEDGDDVLTGGLGLDVLTGGPGDDTFRYTDIRQSRPGSDFRDQIEDSSGEDVVDLRTIDAAAERHGNQGFTFIGGAPFSGEAGQLRFEASSRLLQGDTTGDGAADFEVKFNTAVLLAADDFLL